MNLIKNTVTALTLAFAACMGTAQAESSDRNATFEQVVYTIDSNPAVLVRGDADLWSHRTNQTNYRFWVMHDVVDDRKVVCTIYSTAEESRGTTKFRFPTRSYVLYTAPPGRYVTGFRFHHYDSLRTSAFDFGYVYSYRIGGNLLVDQIYDLNSSQQFWIWGDDWGQDYDIAWDLHGSIEVETKRINYSNLQYQGSMVAPSGPRGSISLR